MEKEKQPVRSQRFSLDHRIELKASLGARRRSKCPNRMLSIRLPDFRVASGSRAMAFVVLSARRGKAVGIERLIQVFALGRRKTRWVLWLLLIAMSSSGNSRCVAADALETVQRTAIEWLKLREETARLEN